MRISVAMAIACLSIGLAMADQADARQTTNIEAQGLAPALQAFAKEQDVQLVYRSDLVGDRWTSGAVGEFTVEEALTKLLSGTGLTFQYLEDKAITIVQASASQQEGRGQQEAADPGNARTTPSRRSMAQASETRQVQPTSTASRANPSTLSDDRNFVIEEIVVTAQKREERLQDVPISISVLSGADLDKSTATGLNEILNSVPGVANLIPITSLWCLYCLV